jgi:hypothetical protein
VSSNPLLKGLLNLALLIGVTGCAGSPQNVPEESLRSAQMDYDDAEKAFLAKQFETAELMYDAAISAGGLPADLLAKAYLNRGIALGHLGQKEEALESLEIASQGEVSELELRNAKKVIAEAQGKS